jgi:beta-glucosidase
MSSTPPAEAPGGPDDLDHRIAALLQRMSLDEKIGQMVLGQPGEGPAPESLGEPVRTGRIGAVINVVDRDTVNELQRIAVEESRLGIPLLVGRDVIHGFQTVMPIPLGQAASFNPELVREAASAAAEEASATGVNWTYAPMVDISRDPRWGRIAESLGEDPLLTAELAVAMVRGFQGEDLSAPEAIAACAKHFAGYGASESGRDYATTNIPENELRNVYLPPFKSCIDAGVASLMTSFSDIDGLPATANDFLLRQVLRDEWGYEGFVVSDWASIPELTTHGLSADDRGAALAAAAAGVDMEMATETYRHLPELVEGGQIPMAVIDAAVSRILRIKFQLGLFDQPYTSDRTDQANEVRQRAFRIARRAATESIVLLKNDNDVLPLNREEINSIAVIGPLADAAYEQLGTWIFDGDPTLSVSALEGIRGLVGDSIQTQHVPALATSRSRDKSGFDSALAAARKTDLSILFLGEESILSGEAHSRADIDLPGAQVELVRRIRQAGKPVVAVIMAGRPLTLSNIVDEVDAILYAWHPGTMGGPAIADLLFGIESPSGKLPVSFPRVVGQIPIYYNQKRGGKPPGPDSIVHIDDIPIEAPQTSLGMTAFHLDTNYTPLFAFGHGLSYTQFEYSNLRTSASTMPPGGTLTVRVDLKNAGQVAAEEVVQLYLCDPVASRTRPVRELKGFRRIGLEPGQSRTVEFELRSDMLGFHGRNNELIVEPGQFHVWIGGSSETSLGTEFQVLAEHETDD